MNLGGVSLIQFLTVAEGVFGRYLSMPENPDPKRMGCFISLLEKGHVPRFLLTAELGSCEPGSKSVKYFGLSQEKPVRTLAHGHFSSWQSRNEKKEQYGGAIIAPPDSLALPIGKIIFTGISGLPELADEAVSSVINLQFHWLTIGDINRIIAINGNPYAYPLISACGNDFIQ